jgi:RNA polymerase sigma-70 factor (ECF subfamily)
MDASNNDSEFVSLLTRHQLALRSYVRSLLPGCSSAEDIAQQANSKIWEKRDTFELGTNFKAWIFSIARYEVLNFRKKQARDSRLVFSEEMEDFMAEEMTVESRDLEHRQVALRHCLETLKPADRELILHRYFKGVPLQAYADELGRSVGSVRVGLHRIRGLLLMCIQRNLSAEGAEA